MFAHQFQRFARFLSSFMMSESLMYILRTFHSSIVPIPKAFRLYLRKHRLRIRPVHFLLCLDLLPAVLLLHILSLDGLLTVLRTVQSASISLNLTKFKWLCVPLLELAQTLSLSPSHPLQESLSNP